MPAGKITNKRDNIKKVYGFGIGINKYQDKHLSQLNGCVRDATDILEAFLSKSNEKILLLDEEATRKNILAVINNYMTQLVKGDLLIISVSSHGGIVNNDLAIVPFDAELKNLLGTVVPTLYLIQALSKIAENGGKILLILDICHSGTLNFDIGKYSSELSGGGISSIYACGPNEMAKEMQFEKKVEKTNDVVYAKDTPKEMIIQKESRGIFTKYLIDGLNAGADFNNLKMITLRNLYDFVYENVCKQVNDQHPALIGTLEGNTILKYLD